MSHALHVRDAASMQALGARIAPYLGAGMLVFLRGPLGAGKTTLVAGLLRALGHEGAVKSPTYTLVEPYTLGDRSVYHFDLYRLRDPEELEFLGMRDYLQGQGIVLVEWPEHGAGSLPAPDIDIVIALDGEQRTVYCESRSERGAAIVQRLNNDTVQGKDR